ncbi:MAG: pyruvate kinase [Verrucomicrobiota bacterium]
MLRKTKIISTLGPVTEERAMIAKLIRAGANIFRLNMSHAAHDWIREVVVEIRAAEEMTESNVALLMDMQGPAIRTGYLQESFLLKVGQELEFTAPGYQPSQALSTATNYPDLYQDIEVGNTMLLDNGLIHVEVLAKNAERILTKVLIPGKLSSRKHINLPGVNVSLPALTDKDEKDLELGVEMGVHFFALSFARQGAHVQYLRERLQSLGSKARIIAKVEDQQAVRNLDEIIHQADAVMVARGDLGIEVPFEELPIIQRRIVKQCTIKSKRVIVATHMLESMTESPVPTRAEVTDVANAVYEQADAVMLSGESAMGKYPEECVQMLDKIARRTERSGGIGYAEFAELKDDKQKSVKAGVVLANSVEDSKILVFTRRGVMAHHISKLRPEKAPIFAFTAAEDVRKTLVLNRAVEAFWCDFDHQDANAMIDRAIEQLKGLGHLESGDKVVILSDVLIGEFLNDAILLRQVT